MSERTDTGISEVYCRSAFKMMSCVRISGLKTHEEVGRMRKLGLLKKLPLTGTCDECTEQTGHTGKYTRREHFLMVGNQKSKHIYSQKVQKLLIHKPMCLVQKCCTMRFPFSAQLLNQKEYIICCYDKDLLLLFQLSGDIYTEHFVMSRRNRLRYFTILKVSPTECV